MSRIAYVTNIDLGEISGGFSAMNRAMYDVLTRGNHVDYIGPISPRPIRWQHWVSKARRLMKVGGDFFYFSKQRLNKIQDQVESQLDKLDSDLVVFHGFTPWIHVHPRTPYVAWSDCCFKQYVEIYHDARQFRAADLRRICDAEAQWLRRAERVLFRNRWAAKETIEEYSLDPARVGVVGNYGFLTPPEQDTFTNSDDFLLITTDFLRKGGDVAVKAFTRFRERFPCARLLIFGSAPPAEMQTLPGVVYKGWVNKSDEAQRAQLVQAYASSRALIHPTTADTNPMVIIEAGYFGCPAISTKRFAIPELIVDHVTGYLIDDPKSVEQVLDAMCSTKQDDGRSHSMRTAVRERMLTNYTKETFERKLGSAIHQTLDGLQFHHSAPNPLPSLR